VAGHLSSVAVATASLGGAGSSQTARSTVPSKSEQLQGQDARMIALLLTVLAETKMLRPEPKLQDQDRDRSQTDLVKTEQHWLGLACSARLSRLSDRATTERLS